MLVERITNKNQKHTRPNMDGTRFEDLRTEFMEQG